MAPKQRPSGSSVPGKQPVARGRRTTRPTTRHRPDREIDVSDIPELTDVQLRKMRRVGRPAEGNAPKQLISLRIDVDLLATIQTLAARQHVGYQTFIQQMLATGVKKALA